MSLSLELAIKILLRKKHRAWQDSPLFSAVIGITLSIIPLVLVLEVSDSMISGIMNRYIETFYSHIKLHFHSHIAPEDKLLERLTQKIRAIPHVQTSYKERNGAALLIYGQENVAVQVRALENQAFAQDQKLRKYLHVVSGKMELLPSSILLASDVAFKLQVQVGDKVALLTGAKFGNRLRPKTEQFLVRGIVSTGYQELDRLWAFISYPDAQSFFHHTNNQLSLHIKIEDALNFTQLRQVADQVQSILPLNWPRPKTWYDQASELQQSYQFTKSILVYIMYLIVAVGTIHIASSMVLLVLENSTEIAIMKTFGASRSLIRNIYVWIAILIGFMAIFCGTLIGTLLSYFINEIISGLNNIIQSSTRLFTNSSQSLNLLDKSYYLEHIPIQLQVRPLLIMSIVVLVLTFLCSIIPALKAANTIPLKILRQNRS